ncbi:hypothetical protein AB0L65_57255 [Nonomuraea sp. NPDC052116]|uniref:hypothetical protein n=1 Tax=Nonomuraea sp. NPDC052116 TaxID=3155665 RepID=UPI00344886C8
MRIIGSLLVVLAVAVAACTTPSGSVSGSESATPTSGRSTPTVPVLEEDEDDETPTPGPLVTPTAGGSGWRYAYISEHEHADSNLTDVIATGRKDAWAVGVDDGSLLVLRYDGSRWRQVDPPRGLGELPSDARVLAAASAPDNVWLLVPTISSADGMDTDTTAVRWDGSRWRKIPGKLETVADLEVFAPDDVWTVYGVERRHARRWDGRVWRKVRLPAEAESISGTGPSDLWAVGARYSGPGITRDEGSQPAAMHWDGRSWRLVSTPTYAFAAPKPPEGGAGLYSVLALAAGDVWAVGEHTFNHGEVDTEPDDPPPVLLHWDGRQWTRRKAPTFGYCCPLPAPDRSGGILLAVGSPGLGDSWRLSPDGRRTGVRRLPFIPGQKRDRRMFALEALAGMPGPRTVWAVGSVAVGDDGRAVIARYR